MTPRRDAAPPRLPYMPGVDGLRALAVGAVVAYHAGADWLPGGFLGVDVFLVISGYLITSLLLTERRVTGGIDLRRFWLRRARRLLPAVVVMIGVVLAVMAVVHPDEVGRLRGAVAASLGYVTNWYLVIAEQSYFAEFARPSVFQHLWSLAVEEQFYLLWPPILASCIATIGRRRLVLGVLAGITASTALAWILFTPHQDPSRIYYGTDTRLAGLLVGVCLAFAWPAERLAGAARRHARALLDAVGVGALAVLAALLFTMGELDARLYRGGFLMVAVVTAVVLAVVVHPASRIGRAFAAPLLVWIGVRSYGIYLWHWPVLMLTRPDRDVPFSGLGLVTVQIALTVALAAASYRWVEAPIRRGGLAALRSGLPGAGASWRRQVATGGVAAAVVIVAGITLLAPSKTPVIPGIPEPASAIGSTPFGPDVPVVPLATAPARKHVAAHRHAVPPGRILAVGDSVLLGASGALRSAVGPRLVVDAVVGRRFGEGAATIIARLHEARTGVVVVHLGNNGYIPFDDLKGMLDRLSGVPEVVLVTTRVDKEWQDSVNDALEWARGYRRNVVLADWHALSTGHPGWFADGTHVNANGAREYAALVARTIRRGRS